jgi:hypothetical protein
VKSPSINKVFVVGAQLGLILIRTERQKIKNDAFTKGRIIRPLFSMSLSLYSFFLNFWPFSFYTD